MPVPSRGKRRGRKNNQPMNITKLYDYAARKKWSKLLKEMDCTTITLQLPSHKAIMSLRTTAYFENARHTGYKYTVNEDKKTNTAEIIKREG